jgi:hypothetical protein
MRISLSSAVGEKSVIGIDCEASEIKDAFKVIKKFKKVILKLDSKYSEASNKSE